MAKLSVLTAFLLVALVAGATATRTIITTTVVEDDGTTSNPQGQCEEQMSVEKMIPCMAYLIDTVGGQSTTDPMPAVLNVCCAQLKSMDDQCKCESLELMMMRQRGSGRFREQEEQKAMQEAMMIPQRCGQSTQQCQFHMLSI